MSYVYIYLFMMQSCFEPRYQKKNTMSERLARDDIIIVSQRPVRVIDAVRSRWRTVIFKRADRAQADVFVARRHAVFTAAEE